MQVMGRFPRPKVASYLYEVICGISPKTTPGITPKTIRRVIFNASIRRSRLVVVFLCV